MDKTECPWKEELLELIDIYYYIYLQVRFVGLKENILSQGMLSSMV